LQSASDLDREEPVATKKRHSETEIAAKLTQAEVLAREGRTQGDIARALQVSVMTFHRWRKAHPRRIATELIETQAAESGRDHGERLAELQLENSRLRRLVTDLLLEKLKLEEGLGQATKKAD
jgi:hypothetical protein